MNGAEKHFLKILKAPQNIIMENVEWWDTLKQTLEIKDHIDFVEKWVLLKENNMDNNRNDRKIGWGWLIIIVFVIYMIYKAYIINGGFH